MGIGVVLIFYFIVLLIAAVICAAILSSVARWYLHDVPAGRRRIVTYAAVLPFACVIYAGIWFIGYWVINDEVFHRDPTIGDGWYTPIGNGYAIDMIDVTDQGSVHPSGGEENGLNDPRGVSGVRRLQVAGTEIFGSEDKNWFQNDGRESREEDIFFAIDTRSHTETDFPTEAALAAFAKQGGAVLGLRPIADVYRDYRNTWFDGVAAVVLFLVPAIVLCWLLRRAVRLKREGVAAGASGSSG